MVMSTTASHSPLNISETVRDRPIETWFQRTTNRKWPMGNRMGIEWSYDQRRHVTLKGQVMTPIRLEPISRKQLEMLFSNSR